MKTRAMGLPSGWYPHSAQSAEDFIKSCNFTRGRAFAAVSPHAGWFFSGKTSLEAISSLKPDANLVVVAGGHLGRAAPVLWTEEEFVQTPFGLLPIDLEFKQVVKKALAEKLPALKSARDADVDNTVEVLLPFVHYLFPNSKVLCLRVPQNIASFELGKLIAECAGENAVRRSAVFIASTDLTHYGRNYGFCPKGTGKNALNWVKEVNDKRFIEAVLAFKPELVLERAENEYSACSSGAVLAALGFAGRQTGGSAKAELLSYTTSADVLAETCYDETGSFVGYAAMAFA